MDRMFEDFGLGPRWSSPFSRETRMEAWVGADPKDPFDFSVDHGNAQLVAGYSTTQVNRGLKTYMPDYNDLRSSGHGAREMTRVVRARPIATGR
jgi:hypothetical protein